MTRSPHFARIFAAVIAFLAAALGVFLYWVGLSGTSVVPHSSYHVTATVPSAVSIAQHADVRQAGVKIGIVDKIDTRGDKAVLRLAIQPKHAPAYRDATALVRGKGLLGENYVDLDPGSPSTGSIPDGGKLAVQTDEPTQLDQILSTMDAKRRRDVRRILDVLGPGLGSHGKGLNRLMGGTAAVVRASRPLAAALARDREQTASLVDDFGRVTRALGDRATDIQTFSRRGRALAEAVAARDAQLRATLAALPGFLRQARITTARLGRFAAGATPVMRDLRLATDDLVPAMTRLRPAARATRTTMRALGGFAHEAAPMAARLRPFSAATARLMGPLGVVLQQVNPLAEYLAPYAREVGSLFSAMRGASEYYDAIGHRIRVGAVLSKSAPVGAFTPQQDAALNALLKIGALNKVADTRGHNSYPKSGSLARPTPFADSYPRLQADPAYPGTR